MGRSCGGLTSKIHALGKANALIDALGKGDILLADKGCSRDALCAQTKQQKARAIKANRKAPFAFSA